MIKDNLISINNIYIIFFFIISILGIYVIIMKNPIWSILFLILLFGFVALYLIILGLEFIGLSYLIVYVGAVSILFLFILMLINIRVSELKNYTNNSIPLIIIILFIFNNIYYQIIPIFNTLFNNKEIFLNIHEINKNFYFVNSKTWDSNLLEMNHISSIGSIMYTNYNMWLFITSFILLLAMVGTIIITMKPIKFNLRD